MKKKDTKNYYNNILNLYGGNHLTLQLSDLKYQSTLHQDRQRPPCKLPGAREDL